MTRPRALVLSLLAGLSLAQCARTDTPAPPATVFTPVLSVKELMEHFIDPTADWIFDAAVVDVSAAGVKETVPVTDEDWLKIERGALQLAESSNLLKMERPVAPAGEAGAAAGPGRPAPELSPAQIQAKIDGDRALWNSHADQLRVAALEVVAIVHERSTAKLFDAGTAIDNACEKCHLEYWYPGDRKAVEADRRKAVTFTTPRSQ